MKQKFHIVYFADYYKAWCKTSPRRWRQHDPRNIGFMPHRDTVP